MAGNYNYDTLMSRNQFYDEWHTFSQWAAQQRSYGSGMYRPKSFLSNPTYRNVMVNGKTDGSSEWKGFHKDFNSSYSRYTTLFSDRKDATARAEAARIAAIKQQEELRRQAAEEKALAAMNAVLQGGVPTSGVRLCLLYYSHNRLIKLTKKIFIINL